MSASASRLHVALVGFMGAGKTLVGRMLAESIGRPFLDLDEVIVAKAGMSIPEIFRQHGEVGFRARERAALRDVLAGADPAVIATGGGTMADAAMREQLRAAACTVYLKASPEVLLARLEVGDNATARPMLKGPDVASRVHRLLADREPGYLQADHIVPTDGRAMTQVVSDVTSLLQLGHAVPPAATRVAARRVASSMGDYPVRIEDGAGAWLAADILEHCAGGRIAILSDSTVAALHARDLVAELAPQRQVTLHTFPAGESAKTLDTVARLYDELLQEGFGRNDLIVALGGGVVGDVAGFVASTLLRGVALIQVPTTTLAVVDSSIGGKTGVNTPRGKNLVGTFYAPRAVLVAMSLLGSQSKRQHVAGLVEAIKMAATLDRELFAVMLDQATALLQFDVAALSYVLERCVALKARIVADDEREYGVRVVLNYGHTLGHAIEQGECYRLLHGEAVGLGMIGESAWAETTGVDGSVRASLTEALSALGAPIDWTRAHVDLQALALDKKRVDQSVRMAVVERLGSFSIREVPVAALTEFVQQRGLACA